MIPEIAGTVPTAERYASLIGDIRLMIPEIAGTVPMSRNEESYHKQSPPHDS